MAKELTKLPTVDVKAINWTIGQARTLEFEENVAYENRRIVNGDELLYTDVDMGLLFDGWVNAERGKKASGDEGGLGNAADLGRCLAKQRAYLMCLDACPPTFSDPPSIPGSSKFRLSTGMTVSDAINAVVKFIGPRGLNLLGTLQIETALGALLLTTDIDKGGMPMADWINSILEQTPGGVWYTKGSDLYVVDFYDQTEAVLKEADFVKGTPDPRLNKLMEGLEVGESTDSKYRGVIVEGAGNFSRKRLLTFNDSGAVTCAPRAGALIHQMGDTGLGTGRESPANVWAFNYRWYLPENVCVDNYFDANGVGQHGCFLSYNATYTESGGPVTRTINDQAVTITPDTDPFAFDVGPTGQLKGDYNGNISYVLNDVVKYNSVWYTCIQANIAQPPTNVDYWAEYVGVNPRLNQFYVGDGWLIFNVGAPSPPVFDISKHEVRYTIYNGPLMASKFSTDPKLAREGEFSFQREDLFKYDQPETRSKTSSLIPPAGPGTYFPILERLYVVDPTVQMQAIADALFPSKCGTMFTGSIPVHMSPALRDIKLGQYVAKFGTNCRIRSIKFDPANRRALLEVSGIPIRDATAALNLLARQKAEKARNWGDRKVIKCTEATNNLPSIVLKENCRPLQEQTTNVVKNGCTLPLGSL